MKPTLKEENGFLVSIVGSYKYTILERLPNGFLCANGGFPVSTHIYSPVYVPNSLVVGKTNAKNDY